VILDVHFPEVVYKKLINAPFRLEDLKAVDPDLLDGLKKLLAYTGSDLEDIFGLTFQVAYDVYGESKTHDLKPGGGDISVTQENKQGTTRAG
jgi:ubiquitin-protein ligase E3 A